MGEMVEEVKDFDAVGGEHDDAGFGKVAADGGKSIGSRLAGFPGKNLSQPGEVL